MSTQTPAELAGADQDRPVSERAAALRRDSPAAYDAVESRAEQLREGGLSSDEAMDRALRATGR